MTITKKTTGPEKGVAETVANTEMVINDRKVDANTKISYAANPKRKGSRAWERYEQYQTATTIGEYLELNQTKAAKADLRHDLMKGFLSIEE